MSDRVKKIGGKYYDMKPENQSFLDVSKELKKLGIKNNKFMLEIKNPDIIGLDPYDQTLSKEQKKMIYHEARKNMWYFLRTLKLDERMYKLTRPLAAASWNFVNNRSFFLRANGETGKTRGLLSGPILWSILTPYQDIEIISNRYANARLKQGLLNVYKNCIPDGFDPTVYGKTSLYGSPTDLQSAISNGRKIGCCNIIMIDDAEFIKYFNSLYSAMLQPHIMSRDKEFGKGCILMCSNKNPDYTLEERLIPDLMFKWDESMYDNTNEEIDEYMKMYLITYSKNINMYPIIYLDYYDQKKYCDFMKNMSLRF